MTYGLEKGIPIAEKSLSSLSCSDLMGHSPNSQGLIVASSLRHEYLVKEILPLQCGKITQSCGEEQSDGGEALGGQVVLRGVLLLLGVAQVVKSVEIEAVDEFLDVRMESAGIQLKNWQTTNLR